MSGILNLPCQILQPMSPSAINRSSAYVRRSRLRRLPRIREKFLAAAACWLACASFTTAAVEVDFGHSNSAATNADQNTGTITLAFTVDGTGNVTLNASCANPGPAANVDEFDGPCGTVSDASMWGQAFSIVLASSGSGSLRVSNLTTGLSVQGQSAHLLDATNEQINVTVNGLGAKFKLQKLDYANATTSAGTQMSVSGTAYDLSGTAGSVDVSAQEITGNFTINSAMDADAQGFVLSGFSFDVVGDTTPPLLANDAVVNFANSGNGYGPTPPFVLAGAGTATITLAFSINNTGAISLDASTTSSNGAFAGIMAEWDNANIGSVADPLLLGKSFTLVGSASGSSGNLSISELGGGGIGIQGENSNRVDGLNYGTDDTTSTPETLTWTLSAPAGLGLVFKSWSSIEGAGGDIRVSNGTTNSDFPNMTVATGTLSLPNLPLANGGSLSFKEIPGMGATTGAGIAGFSFAVVASSAPASEGFDNGAGNNLWTDATNWNPDGVPASPADAIINGYGVILNSAAATSPDGLLIADGSLTVTGTGALSMRAMTLGRDLTKTVRLVIHGSSVSFGDYGSSATDEFAVGSAATVETKLDSGGSEPLELGAAKLVLDVGSEWLLDGTHFTGPFDIGDRFVLANFGSFSGSTAAIRTRNFDLPSNRRLELVSTTTSIYYEVKAQTAATGPNIIIINVDDMAADQHFGFDGRDCITPTLDALASGGLKFNAGFCSSPVCGSSRYSLLTSRWPSRNTSENFKTLFPDGTLGRFGVSDTELEHDGQNIGAWLQQAGYRTGFVGKSHVLDDDLKTTSLWAAKGLQTYSKTADPATNATVNASMQHNHRIVCQNMRALGFDYVDGFYHANLLELYSTPLNVHNQEWITSRALKFIEENRSERFFLYMAPTINHGPVNNDLDYTLRADPRYTSAGFLPNEDYSFMPTRQSIINEVQAAGKDLISARETWLDYSVRAILNKLTAYGIRNDTLIIFTSDHGEKTLSTPVVWGKTTLFDLGMKVPLVMNWPNGITNPGRAYNELVSHVDIGTTLLALTGASNLPTRAPDGVSLVSVFNGSSAPVRSSVFGEIGYARGVRTKTHKYISVRYTPTIHTQIAQGYRWPKYVQTSSGWVVDPNGATIPRPYYVNNNGLGALGSETNPTYFDDDQLYNLSTDPNENSNIYGQNPSVAYDLKKLLAGYIGGIPNRPFRQFSDSSAEFSPAPAATPTAPGSGTVGMTFNSVNQVQLTWSDASNNELGYVIRKTVNGGTPVIVGEYPCGTTTAAVNLDNGVEDILLQVASYNMQGDSAVTKDLLSPEPWRYRTFFGGSKPSWSSDADGDGVTMLMEYAAGTDPLSASSVAKPAMRMTTDTGKRFLEYVLPRNSRRGAQFRGAVSSDLTTWQSGSPHCTIVEQGTDQLIFRSATPVSGTPRQFIRAEMIDPLGQP